VRGESGVNGGIFRHSFLTVRRAKPNLQSKPRSRHALCFFTCVQMQMSRQSLACRCGVNKWDYLGMINYQLVACKCMKTKACQICDPDREWPCFDTHGQIVSGTRNAAYSSSECSAKNSAPEPGDCADGCEPAGVTVSCWDT